VLRFIGKTCLTAAFVLASYLVWVLWGTGIYTQQQQDALRGEIERRIRDPRPTPTVVLPGDAYAIIKIPSIQVNEVVVQGTEVEALKKGPGHYEMTNDPWQGHGRVGIAGHRTTYGQPFWSLNEVRRGDVITLFTEFGTYAYRVTRSKEVLPDQVGVLAPTRNPTLVLTTCTPRFSAFRRLIVFASLIPGRGSAPPEGL
jgi:sortase A